MQPKLKFSSLFFIIIFIFISHYSIAQVVIKEKVEIQPQAILSHSPSTNAHTVIFEVDWAAVVVEANNHFYNANLLVKTEVKDNCENTLLTNDWAYGWPNGTQTLTVTNANAIGYNIIVGFAGFYDAY